MKKAHRLMIGLVSATALWGLGAAATAGPGANPLLDPAYANSMDKGIYGDDDRIELYQSTPAGRRAAAATASFILPQDLERTDGGWRVRDQARVPLRDRLGLCAEERFADQPSAAYCSGFLIDTDILATAGHCVGKGDAPSCEQLMVAFDYALTEDGAVRLEYADTDVYRCREVISRELSMRDGQRRDWAVLRLDRPVTGRTPVTVWAEEPPRDEELVVIGHPMGLPSKIAQGGHMRGNDAAAPVFLTDLDTYAGNSGSAVFTLSSIQRGEPEVVGILVAGAPDIEEDAATGCRKSRRCIELDADVSGGAPCSGEQVTKAKWMLDAIPEDYIEPSGSATDAFRNRLLDLVD